MSQETALHCKVSLDDHKRKPFPSYQTRSPFQYQVFCCDVIDILPLGPQTAAVIVIPIFLHVFVSDGYNPKSRNHRSMLLCLLMTSCDLSDQTKGWKTTRKIAVSPLLLLIAKLTKYAQLLVVFNTAASTQMSC